ncbi:hypothetical protein A7U60_g8794 [Sanghuangporus baumii]|uniref:Uncharacterized protein n=1 Tax=Sanghuangporus baumii TaxID=108892 RepID=A0A9Q5N2S2_SANBA|nr:hypothetical protein A7U60_g8794 [Sanghuangporus baumii]
MIASPNPHPYSFTELWKEICIRSYPLIVDQKLNPAYEEPESWRDEFFRIKGEQDKRFEDAANRIRNQRIGAEELKRKRQAKLTDRVIPPKRPRSNGKNASSHVFAYSMYLTYAFACTMRSSGPATPQTLLQKTRREATKIQKSVFGPRNLPSLAPGNSSGFRSKVDVANAKLSQKGSNSVLVNTITARVPGGLSSKPSQLSPSSWKPEPSTKVSVLKAQTQQEPRKHAGIVSVQNGIPRKSLSAPLTQKKSASTLLLPKQWNPSQLQSR